MGKAAERRVRRRGEYLDRISKSDPSAFDHAWALRLASWSRQARRWADQLVDRYGKPTPNPFCVVDRADAELRAMGGEHAVKRQRLATREALNAECSRAVVRVQTWRS